MRNSFVKKITREISVCGGKVFNNTNNTLAEVFLTIKLGSHKTPIILTTYGISGPSAGLNDTSKMVEPNNLQFSRGSATYYYIIALTQRVVLALP